MTFRSTKVYTVYNILRGRKEGGNMLKIVYMKNMHSALL